MHLLSLLSNCITQSCHCWKRADSSGVWIQFNYAPLDLGKLKDWGIGLPIFLLSVQLQDVDNMV
jgi:hypothetical protein